MVSACNVVVAVKTGAVGGGEAGVDEFPQATSKVASPAAMARLKVFRTRLDFTANYSVTATEENSAIPTAEWRSELARTCL
jgi:hypothetical protein